MFKLPHWVIPDKFPAFFESESATAIEMVAKLYGAISDVVDDYNEFVEKVEKIVNEHLTNADQDHETFKVAIRQEFQDFIDIINLKVKGMEADVQEAKDIMLTNIEKTISNYIEKEGISIKLIYDPLTEALELKAGIMGDVMVTHDGLGNVTVIGG